MIRAINNNWVTLFPRLTADGIPKNLPKTIQTTIGHLHKVRKNIFLTTKITVDGIIEETNDVPSEDYLPPRQIKNHEHIVLVIAVKFEDLGGVISSNQTGSFSILFTLLLFVELEISQDYS